MKLTPARALKATPKRSNRSRGGFSLLEVMIAMTMLTIVLSSLSLLAVSIARTAVRNAGKAAETGLLTQEVDRAVAIPIDSLAIRLGQSTLDTPTLRPWPIARAISVAGRADSLTVRVAILPLNQIQRSDSVVQSVLRTR